MMGGAASSGVGMASNQITRKAPKNPEVGQVQHTPDHPTRNQGESEESSKKPEGGGKSAGGASPLEPATTDLQLGPQVHSYQRGKRSPDKVKILSAAAFGFQGGWGAQPGRKAMAEGPGADQAPRQAGDQPAGPSSERAQRHGAAPGKGNTPARTPLTPYKRWYNSNRPGKRERAAGETSRGIPLPENLRLEKGDLKGKGKAKGKEKGKGKGLESKGKEAGKEQGGKGLGKTPPPPPPAKKRPLVTEPGPSAKARQEPDAEYSYYSESDAEPKASASEARPSAKFF